MVKCPRRPGCRRLDELDDVGIVQGFTQGFGILMAQKFGAGKEDQLKKVIGNSVFLSAVFAIFLVLLGQTIAVPVL